ncbi:MAG: hypothetical protein GXX99_03430 [Clostridiales bacterium]|nr:hypothetical protein [Clostridiales bacterium]
MNHQSLMIALVTDTNDPDRLGRVLVTLPALPDGPTLWARVVAPLAGGDRGQCLLPEVGDEVLVAFTQSELSSAYVLGGLWGKQKPPPEGLGGAQNDLKLFRTRSGHSLRFEDREGEERITLTDKNGNSLVISTAEDGLTLTAKSTLALKTDGELTLSGKTIRLQADTVELKADSSLTLDGGGTADLKAGTVNIN